MYLTKPLAVLALAGTALAVPVAPTNAVLSRRQTVFDWIPHYLRNSTARWENLITGHHNHKEGTRSAAQDVANTTVTLPTPLTLTALPASTKTTPAEEDLRFLPVPPHMFNYDDYEKRDEEGVEARGEWIKYPQVTPAPVEARSKHPIVHELSSEPTPTHATQHKRGGIGSFVQNMVGGLAVAIPEKFVANALRPYTELPPPEPAEPTDGYEIPGNYEPRTTPMAVHMENYVKTHGLDLGSTTILPISSPTKTHGRHRLAPSTTLLPSATAAKSDKHAWFESAMSANTHTGYAHRKSHTQSASLNLTNVIVSALVTPAPSVGPRDITAEVPAVPVTRSARDPRVFTRLPVPPQQWATESASWMSRESSLQQKAKSTMSTIVKHLHIEHTTTPAPPLATVIGEVAANYVEAASALILGEADDTTTHSWITSTSLEAPTGTATKTRTWVVHSMVEPTPWLNKDGVAAQVGEIADNYIDAAKDIYADVVSDLYERDVEPTPDPPTARNVKPTPTAEPTSNFIGHNLDNPNIKNADRVRKTSYVEFIDLNNDGKKELQIHDDSYVEYKPTEGDRLDDPNVHTTSWVEFTHHDEKGEVVPHVHYAKVVDYRPEEVVPYVHDTEALDHRLDTDEDDTDEDEWRDE